MSLTFQHFCKQTLFLVSSFKHVLFSFTYSFTAVGLSLKLPQTSKFLLHRKTGGNHHATSDSANLVSGLPFLTSMLLYYFHHVRFIDPVDFQTLLSLVSPLIFMRNKLKSWQESRF